MYSIAKLFAVIGIMHLSCKGRINIPLQNTTQGSLTNIDLSLHVPIASAETELEEIYLQDEQTTSKKTSTLLFKRDDDMLNTTKHTAHPDTHMYDKHTIWSNDYNNNNTGAGGTLTATWRKHLHAKVTPSLHLKYSKNGGNLG